MVNKSEGRTKGMDRAHRGLDFVGADLRVRPGFSNDNGGYKGPRQQARRQMALLSMWVGFLVPLISGCSPTHPTSSLVQSPVYAVPAQQLVVEVQKIVSSPPISLPVEDK